MNHQLGTSLTLVGLKPRQLRTEMVMEMAGPGFRSPVNHPSNLLRPRRISSKPTPGSPPRTRYVLGGHPLGQLHYLFELFLVHVPIRTRFRRSAGFVARGRVRAITLGRPCFPHRLRLLVYYDPAITARYTMGRFCGTFKVQIAVGANLGIQELADATGFLVICFC